MECLADCKKNKIYKIVKIGNLDESVINMLKNILIIPGEKIEVTNSNFCKQSILVKVSNVSYGIDIKIAKQILEDRLKFVESRIKLKSSLMRISDSKGRWGSCNSKGVITFNFRVIMLPPAIIDYVIIHELCHLVEMNHSKNFWKLVETFLPKAPELKMAIKEYGFLLTLFNNM